MLSAVWLMLSTLLYSLELSTGSFPKPLSEAEEQHYLALAQQGDLLLQHPHLLLQRRALPLGGVDLIAQLINGGIQLLQLFFQLLIALLIVCVLSVLKPHLRDALNANGKIKPFIVHARSPLRPPRPKMLLFPAIVQRVNNAGDPGDH